MTSVYILVHEEWDYDGGYWEIRGVYSDKSIAEESLPTFKTDRRFKNPQQPEHDTSCCRIIEETILNRSVLWE